MVDFWKNMKQIIFHSDMKRTQKWKRETKCYENTCGTFNVSKSVQTPNMSVADSWILSGELDCQFNISGVILMKNCLLCKKFVSDAKCVHETETI